MIGVSTSAPVEPTRLMSIRTFGPVTAPPGAVLATSLLSSSPPSSWTSPASGSPAALVEAVPPIDDGVDAFDADVRFDPLSLAPVSTVAAVVPIVPPATRVPVSDA